MKTEGETGGEKEETNFEIDGQVACEALGTWTTLDLGSKAVRGWVRVRGLTEEEVMIPKQAVTPRTPVN